MNLQAWAESFQDTPIELSNIHLVPTSFIESLVKAFSAESQNIYPNVFVLLSYKIVVRKPQKLSNFKSVEEVQRSDKKISYSHKNGTSVIVPITFVAKEWLLG